MRAHVHAQAHEANTRSEDAELTTQVAALLYTSGTTGTPKGVLLSHENLLFVAKTSAELRDLKSSDRVCGLLPLSHIYGLSSVFLATLFAGASLHFLPRFQASSFLKILRDQKLSVLQAVPAVYGKLLSEMKKENVSRRDLASLLPHLRYLHCGGSPLDMALKNEVENLFCLPLHHGYGLTETSPTIAQTRRQTPRSDTSVGQPVPGVEVRIEADRELCVRGPGVMLGYYRDLEKTREVLTEDGWFFTGDLASQGADGALHILGRKKDLIVRSGFNVYPAEVEAALVAHPSVATAAVVGIPHEGNEVVVAFVVLEKDAPPCSERDLAAFLSHRIAPYKRPSHSFFVDVLPQTANGKIRKQELIQAAEKHLLSS